MRNLLLPLAAVPLSVLLCSCGFMTPAQQYAGERKVMSEIAVIQSYHGSPMGDEYHATISGYSSKPETGPSVVKRFGLPGFTDYPREIQLNPGLYALELYCFKSLTKPTFRPTLEISVKAGYAYTVKCDATGGNAAVFVSQETRML
ncbi:hypothetical protein [Rubrivivax sp. A210]|uniref:hypothetical protein n=1 Tax=Rubrivivax sp. A210 TaxID=2772301 RepID=UPI001917AA5B|nr:hypothetical protein [Rubrivivax sp. A210]